MNANDGAMEAAAASGRPIPRDAEGPVFREAWEAEAFAMAVALHEARLFTWSEWAEALSRRIAGAAASRRGAEDSYYGHWLAALEDIIVGKGAASR